jgi:hypothetical protein
MDLACESREVRGIELVDAFRRAFESHPVMIGEVDEIDLDDSFGEVWVEVEVDVVEIMLV